MFIVLCKTYFSLVLFSIRKRASDCIDNIARRTDRSLGRPNSGEMSERRSHEDSGDDGHDDFDNREDLYRTRRNEFRRNEIAMTELAHWKARDDEMEYEFM